MERVLLPENRSKTITPKQGTFFPQKDSFSSFIQPKLTINQPNDIYEQEADAMADKVMRMPDQKNIGLPFFRPGVSTIQRKCAHCEEEEKMTHRKEMNGKDATANHSWEKYVGHLNNGGQALPDEIRDFYEPKFGYDFSQVKVHTDTVAAKSAQSINALAYTNGNNVVFNKGQYAPYTESGKRLLGHELTHVVQQSGADRRMMRKILGRHDIAPAQIDGAKIEKSSLTQSANETVQRAMMCSKRLEAPGLGRIFNHAYIDDTGRNDCLGSGMVGNYAVQTLVSGNFLKGCAAKTDRSTDPLGRTPNSKPCNPKPGITDLSRCLRNAFNSYSDPSVYKNPWGPNSNTFAATLARSCCDDPSSSGLGRVPGWPHPAAPPCDLVKADTVHIAETEDSETLPPDYV